jgi:hypothetical protein
VTEGPEPYSPDAQASAGGQPAGPGTGPAPYGYGTPPPPGGYGQPGYGGYGAPPPGYGAPPPPGGYGQPGHGGYGAYSGGPGPYGGGPYGGGPYGGYGQYGPYGRPAAPKPGIIPLRPLGISDILDGAFTAMRWNPKTILGSSAIVAAISGVLLAVVTYVAERDVFTRMNVVQGQALTPAQAGELAATIFALGGLAVIVTLITNTVLTGVLTVAIGQGVLGKKETLGSAWRATWSRFWALLGAVLLPSLFVVGGFLLILLVLILIAAGLAAAHAAAVGILIAVVGGLTALAFSVLFYIRWYVTIPAVMLEGAGPIKGMGRSWRLVRRSWWRTFWIVILVIVITGIAGTIIKLPFEIGVGVSTFTVTSQQAHVSLLATSVTAIGGIIASTVTTPMVAGVTVLIYADLRMRREGMDITLQAAAASAPGQGPAPSAASQNPGPW